MLQLNDPSRLDTESRRFDSENDAPSVEEQQNVCGSKRCRADLGLTGLLSAGHDSDIVFFFLQTTNITEVMLFALASYKVSHAVVFQHLVAMYY